MEKFFSVSQVSGRLRAQLVLCSLDMDAAFEKDNYIETGMPAETGELSAGVITEWSNEGGVVQFACNNGCVLRVTAVDENVIRFRFSPNGLFEKDFSYAVVPGVLEARHPLVVHEEDEQFLIETGSLKIFVAREGLILRIEDLEGKVISQDEKGFHWYENFEYGGNVVMMSRVIQSREHFFGLGDIPGHKNLRGQRRMLWGSDVYGYDALTDPLYKSIPFFIGVQRGQSYGIFFDNTFRSLFDFGKERPSVSSFWAHGGEMNFYFIEGPTTPKVVERYSKLTGTPEMPPLWALGFHQCKWSYKSEGEVIGIAETFQSLEIPCDAIYVDIDYMDGFRCFTWNRSEDAYPDPARMTSRLNGMGIKTVAIIDPGIKIDPGYFVYQSGLENDVFCKRMDGPLMTGNVWPGPCNFPDFTNPAVRDWWSDLFPAFTNDFGVAGIWTDMNEPAVFTEEKTFPRDVRHDYDGHPCSHRKGHNVYGMQMARATQEGLKKSFPDRRPFVITRSAYAGTQRFSSAWTGDIQSTWEHLKIGNTQCQRLALSGYSFVGTDIGGFSGRSDGELFVRWLQMGVFHPFCRVHSSGDENEQEPWSFGDPYTAIAKKFIELRYRILPYIYTVFEDHTRSGAPMLRSLIYLDDQDPEVHNRADEFALGGDIFTCPVSKPGVDGRWMYLPRGDWYDFWTSELTPGGEERWVNVPLNSTPLYIRAGAILPLSPVRMSSATPLAHMELHLYADGKKASGSLYEDAGDGYGESVRKTFTYEDGKLSQVREGDFKPTYGKYRWYLIGLDFQPKTVSIDGGAKIKIKPGLPIDLPENFTEAVLG